MCAGLTRNLGASRLTTVTFCKHEHLGNITYVTRHTKRIAQASCGLAGFHTGNAESVNRIM